jgi:hypothetical protein
MRRRDPKTLAQLQQRLADNDDVRASSPGIARFSKCPPSKPATWGADPAPRTAGWDAPGTAGNKQLAIQAGAAAWIAGAIERAHG